MSNVENQGDRQPQLNQPVSPMRLARVASLDHCGHSVCYF